MGFIETLKSRDLVQQITHEDEFASHCNEGSRTAYIGFDPTASSLHVGHLAQVMLLRRWQQAGHRVIALMGGGTALVGDPTGKTDMRKMLTQDEINHNISQFKLQVSPLLDFEDAKKGIILNNADWLCDLNYLDFLRDIGRHFSVNRMLTAECFKARLEKGLSFLEFNYMLLQGYDFLHLCENFDCTVQMGGDDQWSNILAGSDLIRRKLSKQAYCVTIPLLATSDGKKMGKTEKGAVWIDKSLTSAYEYFQFWRNIPDDRVGLCLRMFTDLSMDEINTLESSKGAAINDAKISLAFECTKLIHGVDGAAEAKATAESLFTSVAGGQGNEPEHFVGQDLVGPESKVGDILAESGIFTSKGELRRLISQGGIVISGEKVKDFNEAFNSDWWESDSSCLVRKGKKHYYRLRIRK